MTFNFYTITHDGIGYGFDTSVRGVKVVAEYLCIKPERVTRGALAGSQTLTQEVLTIIQVADRTDLLHTEVVTAGYGQGADALVGLRQEWTHV